MFLIDIISIGFINLVIIRNRIESTYIILKNNNFPINNKRWLKFYLANMYYVS